MKSLKALWLKVLDEYGDLCRVSTTEDRKTFLRRADSEGMEFLTITLPELGKQFERALALQGSHDPALFEGWKRRRTAAGAEILMPTIGIKVTNPFEIRTNPLFLGGFFDLVFDSLSGVPLDEPNMDAILAIRQLTLMFGKLLVPTSDARVEKAMRGYVEIEQEIRRNDVELETRTWVLPNQELGLLESFQKASLVMFGSVLQQVDEDVYYGRITPKHGPGATADRLKGNRKFDQVQWTERLERIFPYGENVLPNWRYHSAYSRVNFLDPGSELPVKVIHVPKTAKAPRIIAIEPTCMQYMQQGLLRKFVRYLEQRNTGPWLGNRNRGFGYVGFTDQTPNQRLAREGSLTGELATLDLSEASDRVSWLLVKSLVGSFPNLREGVAATRSRRAHVPELNVTLRLAKFASMGSALTFPMEAMVFATVVMMAIGKAHGTPVTPELCEEYRGKVRVYGDDIIVPVEHADLVVETLELFGFKVNSSKSFWTGKFRESCGKEFFDGVDVSIVRCRREFPTRLDQVEEIMSLVSFRNQLYSVGLWRTCGWLDRQLETLFRGYYPVVEESSPVLGRFSYLGYQPEKYDEELHSPLVQGYVPKIRKRRSALNGLGALVKFYLNHGSLPAAEEVDIHQRWWDEVFPFGGDPDHLLYGGRPKSVDIRLRWGSPF